MVDERLESLINKYTYRYTIYSHWFVLVFCKDGIIPLQTIPLKVNAYPNIFWRNVLMVLQKLWYLKRWKNLWEERKEIFLLLFVTSKRHFVNSVYVEIKCFRWRGLLVQEFLCSSHRNIQQRVTISQEYTFPVNRKKHMYLCIVLLTYNIVSIRKPEILLITTSLHSANRSKQIILFDILNIVQFNILA